MKLKKLALLCASSVIVLSGCTTPHPPVGKDSVSFAERILADKAVVAAESQAKYAALVAEDKEIVLRKQNSIETDEVDIDFIGSPHELLQTFAYRYGYRYVETGPRRQLRNINIKIVKSSPTEVLRQIGNQITYAGDIVLDKQTKTVRLIFKPMTTRG